MEPTVPQAGGREAPGHQSLLFLSLPGAQLHKLRAGATSKFSRPCPDGQLATEGAAASQGPRLRDGTGCTGPPRGESHSPAQVPDQIRAHSCPNPGPETRRPTGAARGQEHPLPNETFVGETKETSSLYARLPWEAGREDGGEGGPPRLRRKPADPCLPRGSCPAAGGPPPPGHLAANREHRLRKQPCEPASFSAVRQPVPWDPERRSFHL